MKNYIYQNNLIGKKELRQILGWSFKNYECTESCSLADELKDLGFKYATQSGISISIEDLRVPFSKNMMLEEANKEINNSERIYLKGKITEVERFQRIISIWSLTSESLKNQIVSFFKKYDPLNSVFIMSFSGARGNLSQVRQLIGMRGLMSDPSGEIMNLPIIKNFREGLTITDYLISGYGARKGIVDTSLKTANSGYLTRRLIDVAQDILIREKDCYTIYSFRILSNKIISEQVIGRVLNQSVIDPITSSQIVKKNTQITSALLNTFKQKKILTFYIRSPLTCKLYRGICQQCYGWNLANENLVDIGEAIGILAGQSIGEPGTQLTMRTFHTGGVFNAQFNKKIFSPIGGIFQFSNSLKVDQIRTNRGDNVVITRSSGSIIIIGDSCNNNIVTMNFLPNTILFPQHNQYVKEHTVIGELINPKRQIRQEIKPILAITDGQVIIPKLKFDINRRINDKLFWILAGNVYSSPLNSYVNFCSDYKINKNSFVFRAKIINSYRGNILFQNQNSTLYGHRLILNNYIYSLKNSRFLKLLTEIGNAQVLLKINSYNYLLYTSVRKHKTYLKILSNNRIARLITNAYKTKTGGILFYDKRSITHQKTSKFEIHVSAFFKVELIERRLLQKFPKSTRTTTAYYNTQGFFPRVFYRTMLWIDEETYFFNSYSDLIGIQDGDFIVDNYEIMPNIFSKTYGLVSIEDKNEIIQKIIIKSGLLYEGIDFFEESNKVYFPGEQILDFIDVDSPSFCECIHRLNENDNRLLVRDIKLYEVPYSKTNKTIFNTSTQFKQGLKFTPDLILLYTSNQKFYSATSITLIVETLKLTNKPRHLKIELINDKKEKNIKFNIYNQIHLNGYIFPQLKYKNLLSCSLVQVNQFVDQYTKLVYLESITSEYFEVVKVKCNYREIKQILVIKNKDCIRIKKNQLFNKKINDFIFDTDYFNYVGKIISKTNNYFILQKGQPYFFPNCDMTNHSYKNEISYNFLPSKYYKNFRQVKNNINVNHFNAFKTLIEITPQFYKAKQKKLINDIQDIFSHYLKNSDFLNAKMKFSKMFIKKNGKMYTSMIPRFVQKFNIGKDSCLNNFSFSKFCNYKYKRRHKRSVKLQTTLLVRTSEIKSNNLNSQALTLVKFLEYPFTRSTKSIGLYSITDNFSEYDLNNFFCSHNQFIESGEPIGLLKLDKEITGDIVQGLPKIEAILEARKKNTNIVKMPHVKKIGLLTQKPSLNHNFEFYNLGRLFKQSERTNPHKLLKIYFNYYGLKKSFLCDQKQILKMARLTSNFEGSYRCFKNVQSFILNSVQEVYESQGVTINNKHLEVIIRQMTTKVLITIEGDTPLLKREIIDLYHIEYMNKVIKNDNKCCAFYVPILFGITRAALNNPSFISAASFQETTRVLAKAAIEGRIDWLRGLKENIITGHLIPAGTGSLSYRTTFQKPLMTLVDENYLINSLQI